MCPPLTLRLITTATHSCKELSALFKDAILQANRSVVPINRRVDSFMIWVKWNGVVQAQLRTLSCLVFREQVHRFTKLPSSTRRVDRSPVPDELCACCTPQKDH